MALDTVLLVQSPQATITGTITDQQGARVAGVDVVALRVDTQQKYTGVSPADGTYVIPALPIGKYDITAGDFSNTRDARAE